MSFKENRLIATIAFIMFFCLASVALYLVRDEPDNISEIIARCQWVVCTLIGAMVGQHVKDIFVSKYNNGFNGKYVSTPVDKDEG